ncbi:MAG: ribosome maturation factor RimM [Anaerolineales bacterium]|jgi:16S rRNA processing protein RimM
MAEGSVEKLVAVARVRRPFGLRGELLLEIVAGTADFLRQSKIVFVGKQRQRRDVLSFRSHGKDLLLCLDGCANRTGAEELRGALLYVQEDHLPPLPAGTYYRNQLEGLRVVTEDGRDLGRLLSVLATGANDVYVVQGNQGEILLPAISSVVREIRLSEGRMVVRLPEGQLGA